MRIKQYILAIAFYLCTLCSMKVGADVENNYATEFKNMALQSCDKTFHKLELDDKCPNMICRDILVNALAECWKRSMNSELNKRLLKLKNIDVAEFYSEIALQKSFNQATQNVCGKDCGSNGMKGISYNFCRIDAYKYRTEQAIQININKLSVPMKEDIGLKESKIYKNKIKDTNFFNTFSEQLCKMPKNIWSEGNPPVDCQKKVFMELNRFEFTDDVCDLS